MKFILSALILTVGFAAHAEIEIYNTVKGSLVEISGLGVKCILPINTHVTYLGVGPLGKHAFRMADYKGVESIDKYNVAPCQTKAPLLVDSLADLQKIDVDTE
jgi:hypothetical protein